MLGNLARNEIHGWDMHNCDAMQSRQVCLHAKTGSKTKQNKTKENQMENSNNVHFAVG